MMKRMILAVGILSMAFVLHAQKFGHVTSELLLQAMPEYDSAQATLAELQQHYELEIERIQVGRSRAHYEGFSCYRGSSGE